MKNIEVKTQNWQEIENLYCSLIYEFAWPIQPMLDLVRFIKSSPYSQGIFPSIRFHWKLVLHRAENPIWGDNELLIDFDFKKNEFIFSYRQHHNERIPFSRAVDISKGCFYFEHLVVKRLRWFCKR